MYSQITKRAFNLILEKKYELMKVLLLPFIFFAIMNQFGVLKSLITTKGINLTVISVIIISIYLIINVSMAVQIHRILLLEEKASFLAIIKIGSREITFILVVLGITFLSIMAYLMILIIIGFFSRFGDIAKLFELVFLIGFLIYLFALFTRLSLVFPSIAVDRRISMFKALELTKNHKLLVCLTVSVIPLLLASIIFFAYSLVINFLASVIFEEFKILYALLNIFITVFIISFLSVTYEYIISKEDNEENNEVVLKELKYETGENSFRMFIDENYNISFEQLTQLLLEQYEKLGFDNIVLNKEDNWMLKNSANPNAYISLVHRQKEFIIETYGIDVKPEVNIGK